MLSGFSAKRMLHNCKTIFQKTYIKKVGIPVSKGTLWMLQQKHSTLGFYILLLRHFPFNWAVEMDLRGTLRVYAFLRVYTYTYLKKKQKTTLVFRVLYVSMAAWYTYIIYNTKHTKICTCTCKYVLFSDPFYFCSISFLVWERNGERKFPKNF